MRAVTISFPTDVEQWFTYQVDLAEQEERDQLALERGWQTLHKYMPELGADIEVIETANPQSFYETTRRKLGMVGGSLSPQAPTTHLTSLPNVFMVGDTAFPFGGIAGASHSGLIVANEITQS
jgi:phytoene dehydrogenase-like protein